MNDKFKKNILKKKKKTKQNIIQPEAKFER